jgi:hypothetical protein
MLVGQAMTSPVVTGLDQSLMDRCRQSRSNPLKRAVRADHALLTAGTTALRGRLAGRRQP